MLAGQIGREAAVASRLAQEGNELVIAAEYPNPSLVEAAEASGGGFHQVNTQNTRLLGALASATEPDLVWINDDNILARGAVDIMRRQVPETLFASPDKEGARLEWDKFDTRLIIEEIDNEWGTYYNPRHVLATTPEAVAGAVSYFEQEGSEVAIKPRGLSGGKLVKVMGPHLRDHSEARDYGVELITGNGYDGVSVEEKIDGREFTVQALTDGKTLVMTPGTYDYPYRLDDDTGPGTGGMGSFTMPAGERLPFLTDDEQWQAGHLMEKVLKKLEERGRDFKGVLYASFFKTAEGLKLTEFNARGGDPEFINTIELLEDDVSLTDVLGRIATGELRREDLRFKQLASTVVYLVSPDYAYPERPPQEYDFGLDPRVIVDRDCWPYFAAAQQIDTRRYRTVGTSRTVAIASLAETPTEARAKILDAIDAGVEGPLEHRSDIASAEYLERLAATS